MRARKTSLCKFLGAAAASGTANAPIDANTLTVFGRTWLAARRSMRSSRCGEASSIGSSTRMPQATRSYSLYPLGHAASAQGAAWRLRLLEIPKVNASVRDSSGGRDENESGVPAVIKAIPTK